MHEFTFAVCENCRHRRLVECLAVEILNGIHKLVHVSIKIVWKTENTPLGCMQDDKQQMNLAFLVCILIGSQ
jgi:hypothetical protein